MERGLKWETLAVTGAKIVQVFERGGRDFPGTTKWRGGAEIAEISCKTESGQGWKMFRGGKGGGLVFWKPFSWWRKNLLWHKLNFFRSGAQSFLPPVKELKGKKGKRREMFPGPNGLKMLSWPKRDFPVWWRTGDWRGRPPKGPRGGSGSIYIQYSSQDVGGCQIAIVGKVAAIQNT
jgi:hypothetical protein